ncbi:MAG: putative metalloprotease CJM1_0395 family protein [Treponemataceae bacterium]
MRIVYDYGNTPHNMPHISPRVHGRSETVIVISKERKQAVDSRGGLTISGTDYEVRISDEALARDREVKAHEQAHLAVLGGAAASGIQYDTQTGPGGESVAVGGRIAVDMAEVPGDPAATLRKARSIIAAAYAPGVSSAADVRTAANAYEMARKASAEMHDNTRTRH